eukprot:74182-Pelagomonas_calceolata.AAC.1
MLPLQKNGSFRQFVTHVDGRMLGTFHQVKEHIIMLKQSTPESPHRLCARTTLGACYNFKLLGSFGPDRPYFSFSSAATIEMYRRKTLTTADQRSCTSTLKALFPGSNLPVLNMATSAQNASRAMLTSAYRIRRSAFAREHTEPSWGEIHNTILEHFTKIWHGTFSVQL